MSPRVKLTLNEFESRQMLDAAPVLPPGGATVAQTAVVDQQSDTAVPAWLGEFEANRTTITANFNAELQASGDLPGLQVTRVALHPAEGSQAADRSQATLQVTFEPRPGEATGQPSRTELFVPVANLDGQTPVENLGFNWLRRGAVGATAGAGAGFVGGAVLGAIGGPFAGATGGAGAAGGAVVGFVYGAFIAADIPDAAVGGAVSGLAGGAVVNGVRVIVLGRAMTLAEAETASAAAAAAAAYPRVSVTSVQQANKIIEASGDYLRRNPTGPLVQDHLTSRQDAYDFLARVGGR